MSTRQGTIVFRFLFFCFERMNHELTSIEPQEFWECNGINLASASRLGIQYSELKASPTVTIKISGSFLTKKKIN